MTSSHKAKAKQCQRAIHIAKGKAFYRIFHSLLKKDLLKVNYADMQMNRVSITEKCSMLIP